MMINVLRGQLPGSGPATGSAHIPEEPNTVAPDVSGRSLMVQVISQIESRVPGRIRGLFVSRKGEHYVLGGSCHSYYAKQVAQHMAMEVLDYRRVVNNITVLPPK